MADIASVFHWPLSDLNALSLDDLGYWRQLAAQRSGSADEE